MKTNISIAILCRPGTDTKRFRDMLAPEGWSICEAHSASDILVRSAGVVIMYLCTPDDISELRGYTDAPVMYAARRADEFTVITAVSRGADIVVPLDISRIELAARTNVLVRRSSTAAVRSRITPVRISCGSIELDTAGRSVFLGGEQISITVTEFGILEYLIRNCGRVCSAEEIYRAVWHTDSYKVKKTIVEHIRRLRRKLGDDPGAPSLIKSVFGAGYILSERAASMEKTA